MRFRTFIVIIFRKTQRDSWRTLHTTEPHSMLLHGYWNWKLYKTKLHFVSLLYDVHWIEDWLNRELIQSVRNVTDTTLLSKRNPICSATTYSWNPTCQRRRHVCLSGQILISLISSILFSFYRKFTLFCLEISDSFLFRIHWCLMYLMNIDGRIWLLLCFMTVLFRVHQWLTHSYLRFVVLFARQWIYLTVERAGN